MQVIHDRMQHLHVGSQALNVVSSHSMMIINSHAHINTHTFAHMQVIHDGMQHRHVGSHALNIESSRSHSMMTIHCHALPSDPNAWDHGTARCGKICFVDLAGSERLKVRVVCLCV
jgi:hypothetical protein